MTRETALNALHQVLTLRRMQLRLVGPLGWGSEAEAKALEREIDEIAEALRVALAWP